MCNKKLHVPYTKESSPKENGVNDSVETNYGLAMICVFDLLRSRVKFRPVFLWVMLVDVVALMDAMKECMINMPDDALAKQNSSQGEGAALAWIMEPPRKLKRLAGQFRRRCWKLGKDDPRRVVHSIKVGLALAVVSLFYLMEPLFDGVGDNAIWAIMTVVVVFEFTAGATLSKGLNRGMGTLVAGILGILVGYSSNEAGTTGQAIIIGASVFILGTASTFSRFLPKIKSKYDYGVVIFLLTFNLITVSGYRVDNIFRMAYQRLATIAIGCGISLAISLFIRPIWAGEDLHNSIINNIEGLAGCIQGCVREYFDESEKNLKELTERNETAEDPIYKGYRTVLDSKASEESLATFASWEPRHGRFPFRYPWHQYVKVGASVRYLAYSVVALHACLQSEIQTPRSIRTVFMKPCNKISSEASRVLQEIADSIREMRRCECAETLMEELEIAVKELNASFRAQPKLFVDSKNLLVHQIPESPMQSTPANNAPADLENEESTKRLCRRFQSWHCGLSAQPALNSSSRAGVEFSEALPLATFASLLVEIVVRLEHVIEAVEELAKLAKFKQYLRDHLPPRRFLPNQQERLESHPSIQQGE
eukprot:Gb_21421 [translate_table: standard]